MNQNWHEELRDATAALLATKNEAVVYFASRDLLGQVAGPIQVVWELAEPQNILRKQSTDGS